MHIFTQVKENYRQAIEVSNVTDFWTNQVCRRIAAIIVILINPTPITPNIVTVVSFAVNIGANYQLLNNQLGMAALLYFFAYVLDCADGQLARLRDSVSQFGIYFDLISDNLKELITFLSFVIYFSPGNLFYFSLIAMLLVSFSNLLDWVRKTLTNNVKESNSVKTNVIGKYGIVFWSGPIRNFVIMVCLIIGLPEGIIYYVCFPGIYFILKKVVKIFTIINI